MWKEPVQASTLTRLWAMNVLLFTLEDGLLLILDKSTQSWYLSGSYGSKVLLKTTILNVAD